MTIGIDIRADIKAVERDLTDIEKRKVPRAAASALNAHNGKVRTRVARGVAHRFGIKVRAAKRQIRIPRFLRARANRLKTGAFADVFIPSSAAPSGQEYTFDNGRPIPVSGATKTFQAQVGKGEHVGNFIRMRDAQRRTKGRPASSPPNLPIKEIFTNQGEAALDEAQSAIFHLRGDWSKTFTNELNWRLGRTG